MPPLRTIVGDRNTVRVVFDDHGLVDAIKQAPAAAYFWLRNYMFGCSFGHRKAWLAAKGTKFGRRGSDPQSRAVRVSKVGEAPAAPDFNDVVYDVQPKERRVEQGAAPAALARLSTSIYTGSTALKVHEFGEDIRVNRWMAIAYKTRPKKIDAWRKKYPDRQLVTIPSKGGQSLLVFEKKKVRARGRPRKGEEKPTTERLQLRFVLRKFVEMEPTLKFYDSWDALQADRDSRFRDTANRLLKDIARGVIA